MSFLGAQNSIALGVQGIIAIDTGTGTIAVVTDPYWPFVSTLLHGDGVNAAQNNTFLDGSTNNFTVTRNGNTTQGSFNPFVSTYPYDVATNGGSAYFDGTGDTITVPANVAFNLGVNDFTIECWVNSAFSGNRGVAGQRDDTGAAVLSSFYMLGIGTDLRCGILSGGTAYQINVTMTANVWSHVAFVRDGATTRVYVNGVQQGTAAVSTVVVNTSVQLFKVGSSGDTAFSPFNGYISNFRLVNGTCLYPSGTTFTPPTAPLTAVTNTALLLGMSNGAIYDNTMLNNLETVANAQISTSVFKYGTGALKFNGTTDYLPTPAKTAFVLGSADFTIEFWLNTPSLAVGQNPAGQSDATGTDYSFYIFLSSTGLINGTLLNAAQTVQVVASAAAGTIVANTWYHIAFVRDGNTVRMYVNGVQGSITGNSTAYTVRTPTAVAPLSVGNFGGYTGGGTYFNGYIDDFRFTKGICRYPSGTTFTPPTAAFPNLGPTYPSGTATQRAIFGYGNTGSLNVSMTNIVSNTGVVVGDTTGVGTARGEPAATNYGGDKAIFGYGNATGPVSLSNLVSNAGVVAADTTGVGTARYGLAASGYGTTGQAIFGFGNSGARTAITNLLSNTGVVATDTTGVGTARMDLAAAKYSTDKAIFAFGSSGSGAVSLNNLVSNTGVVATDTTSTATARQYQPGGASYGVGLAIFGYGMDASFTALNSTNLVSNTGVVASDTTGVGTARNYIAASSYGDDKAIFGYGNTASAVSMTNLVSNTGVVATDTTGVGSARYGPAAAGFSYS